MILRMPEVTTLPLPVRAWAAKRTKVGGRGANPRQPSWIAPLPPPLVRFAVQALKGSGSLLPSGRP
jgi:hypothetical protein